MKLHSPSKQYHSALLLMLSACAVLGLVGCTTTRQVHKEQQSGFLGDYSMLRQGVGHEANCIYIDEAVDWSQYTKIWIKPIELWKSDDPESPLNQLDKQQQQVVVESFYAAMYEALTNNFQLVDHAGPDVLVIHAALTDGRPSKPVVDVVTSVYLPLKLVSLADRFITGTDIGVGLAVVEAEFLDGQSGKRIGAVMDARAGTKALRSKFRSKWNDVKLAFDWWAERLDKRLLLLRKGDFGTTNL